MELVARSSDTHCWPRHLRRLHLLAMERRILSCNTIIHLQASHGDWRMLQHLLPRLALLYAGLLHSYILSAIGRLQSSGRRRTHRAFDACTQYVE